MDFDPIYLNFHTALVHHANNKWRRRLKTIALNSGISSGYITDLVKGNKKASYNIQKKIAESMGETWESFIAFGRSLILASVTESTTSTDAIDVTVTLKGEPLPPPGPLPTPDTKPKPPSPSKNVLGFPDRRRPKEVDINSMYVNLNKICENEDNALVIMIERSLSLLSEAVDLKSELTALRDRIEKIEDQLNMEKAEKQSLKEENETLKKRLPA